MFSFITSNEKSFTYYAKKVMTEIDMIKIFKHLQIKFFT